MMFRTSLFLFLIVTAVPPLFANNITVSDTRLTEYSGTEQLTYVNFDLSWANSWRLTTAPANHDAAWVFVKYRERGGTWKHATIIGGAKAGGTVLAVPSDQRGAFIYRATPGTGTVNFNDNRLLWDYGADGVENYALVTVRVFAVEMVHIPAGPYTLGYCSEDAGASASLIRLTGPSSAALYRVASEAAISVGTNTDDMYYGATANEGGDISGPIPAAFPKGTRAFYSMKYEVTQAQYVNFFNTLTAAQQPALDLTDAAGKDSTAVINRNGFSVAADGQASTTSPDVPVNFISAARAWAYLDWAGLRPMTELEYEKAARGPAAVVFNEYAWGSTSISTASHTLSDRDGPTERLLGVDAAAGNAAYNFNYDAIGTALGPIRAGGVAASIPTASRVRTGASYYGVMDLSGNLYELLITVGSPAGRAFTGNHGDGNLSTTEPSWPGATIGYGVRGGGYSTPAAQLRVSDRRFMTYTNANGISLIGFRGVRTDQ